jgi:DNA ligase (NAD+)
VDKLLVSIETSKSRPYAKTLYALGIPNVGKFLGNLLARKSKNIDVLAQMSVEELLAIGDVGEKIANAVYDFFHTKKTMEIVEKLKKNDVNFSHTEREVEAIAKKVEKNIFSGKTFLFTGKLNHFKREDIKELIESLGGQNLSGVSKKLDYLIVGEDAGSKLVKAQALESIKILTESEFIALCGDKIKL